MRKSSIGVLGISLLAFSVTGCSMAPFYSQIKAAGDQAVEQGIEDRMGYNDKKAELFLKAPCDISIGAYHRLTNPNQQKGVNLLCSPAGEALEETAP